MKTKNAKRLASVGDANNSDLIKAVQAAARHMRNGDPVEAQSCLDLALKQDMPLDVRKLIEKAHDEVSLGVPDIAEHRIGFALAALLEMKAKGAK